MLLWRAPSVLALAQAPILPTLICQTRVPPLIGSVHDNSVRLWVEGSIRAQLVSSRSSFNSAALLKKLSPLQFVQWPFVAATDDKEDGLSAEGKFERPLRCTKAAAVADSSPPYKTFIGQQQHFLCIAANDDDAVQQRAATPSKTDWRCQKRVNRKVLRFCCPYLPTFFASSISFGRKLLLLQVPNIKQDLILSTCNYYYHHQNCLL
ncbi:hypothetical protein M514_08237 [Trichuris suis]|uniref:Uncharacterized protein n=1 Tax=Trichuris suis TaxID=68888 RepID=A0A085N768_9BILA|nr:hypothetical protein M513_08237 [Trichuris suis]KFD65314.1 hypothetical protein M514_08237 [Trichuris suis]